LSPCILPLIPAYLTFLAKTSFSEVSKNEKESRKEVFLASLCFVIGFSFVFSILGVLLQSTLSSVAYDLRTYLSYLGGVIIILFGLLLTGILEFPALSKEYKFHVKSIDNRYLSSLIFGAAFAVGWSPCVGAVLGSILTLAVTSPQNAFPLMLSYSLGLGIPFLIAGAFLAQFNSFMKFVSPYIKTINLVFGIVLIILGILVFTGTLSSVANLDFLNIYLLR
jgi:cytochrome c-type biogenesis protein